MGYMDYFLKRAMYDAARAKARNKQAKKRAKQQAKIDKIKAVEKARKEEAKAKEKAQKEMERAIKNQEREMREQAKAKEKIERERIAQERALHKAKTLCVKTNTLIDKTERLIHFLREEGEEVLILSQGELDDFKQFIEKVGSEKALKKANGLIKKCDTVMSNLDKIDKDILQLLELGDKYNLNVTIWSYDEWFDIYKEQYEFASNLKDGFIILVDIIEELEVITEEEENEYYER